ncbi:hypothetical protein SEA_SATIS_90 [Streptomyces phage Satis]|nr:hypothetical protein SEA_SATIS_90 [Streptomyces phage Satis]QBZ71988.1 hypothetical protein SEA_KRADAL_90 [Streptomyces phage Kradal]
MTYEDDKIYGTPARRTLAYTRPYEDPTMAFRPPVAPARPDVPTMVTGEGSAHGPEAVERAQMMAYERTKLIQQESPYISQEVVEHKVHDYRLYIGMWIVAGISAVTAFLTFDLMHLAIAGVAVVFALMSSPGQQYRDVD